MQRSKPLPSVDTYVEGIRRGDRVWLGRAITLVESTLAEHQQHAQSVLEACLPHTGRSLRIGITGVPGVGKSSFIETFGTYLTQTKGRKLAVLAIDPSSRVSGGSILGDKTRMERLSADANAFIRPSPSGQSLGGVAARTRESMLLCEAAGFDTVLVETVGVGQSEVAVHGMVDFFLLLLLPGAGDDLQGIKRGIVEMADLIAINKADGDRVELARAARRDYSGALHLFPAKDSGWAPKAVTCSALTGDGMPEVWEQIIDFQVLAEKKGWLEENRRQQLKQWLHELLGQRLHEFFLQKPGVREALAQAEADVLAARLSPVNGVREVLRFF